MGLLNLALDVAAPWPLKLLGGVKSACAWVLSSTTHILICVSVGLGGVAWYEAHRATVWADKAASLAHTLDNERKASQALAAAYAAKSKDNANEAQSNYVAISTAGNDRVRAFIIANGVRDNSHSAIAAKGGDTGILDIAPAEAVVASIDNVTVKKSDVLICDANYTYAQASYDWAQGINK